MSEREDLGHGVSVERLDVVDGKPQALAFYHPCKGEESGSWLQLVRRDPGPAWHLISAQPLTIAPSVLCIACGHHGFIRDGKWVPV